MDESLRELQRQALGGDEIAVQRYKAARARAGLPDLNEDLARKEIEDKLLGIFREYDWRYLDITFTKLNHGPGWGESREKGWGVEIEISQEYEYIEHGFSELKQLSELFGTDQIDVDNWGQSGCETCDHGSNYTVQFQVYNPTRNTSKLFQEDSDG